MDSILGIVGKYEKKSEIQWNYARVFRTDAHTDGPTEIWNNPGVSFPRILQEVK